MGGIGIRQQTCCILGNRLLPRGQADEIAARLEEKILKLRDLGVTRFFTGGGLGFDTLAAQVVLRVRDAHPDISLVLVLPCRDQAAKWPAAAVATYEHIKTLAAEIIYTAETTSRGHILKRNRYMVDESDYVLTHLSKTSGRTAQTIRYAEKTDHVVINVAKGHEENAGGNSF